MRINFRYGAAVGILAAAFSTLGPVAAHAGQTPGAPVPNGARTVSVQAPAAHLFAITGKAVVLSSTLERPAWQHDTGIAQREDSTVGNGQQRLGLPGQNNRMLGQSYRCGYGYYYGHCCGYGYGYGYGCGYGYGHGCYGYGCYGYGHYHYGHYHYGYNHYGNGHYGNGHYGNGHYGNGHYGNGHYGNGH